MLHEDFVSELFRSLPENNYLNIWTYPEKKSKFFNNDKEASDYVEGARSGLKDIYIGCGFLNRRPINGSRGYEKDIAGIPGFWMDVDYGKDGCPPTEVEAIDLVKDCGIMPTLIIHSGHGIHAWWLFKEPWVFENDADRQKAKNLSLRLQQTVKAKAADKGWTGLDSTHDLTRVLRIPGTYNYKDKKNPVEVRLIANTGQRYGDPESEFDQVCLAVDSAKTNPTPSSLPIDTSKMVNGLDLRADANPPADLLSDLLEINVNFKASWNGKRHDFKKNSPSEYALSLANYAVEAGWSDQEIADLIIAFYRKHSDSSVFDKPPLIEKALRSDYIARTIEKARERSEDLPRAELSEKLGIKINRITKFIGDDPSYVMETDKGEVELRSVNYLIELPKLRSRIAAHLDVYINPNKKEWGAIAQGLLDLCEEVEVSPDAEVKPRMAIWIGEYLHPRGKISLDDSMSRSSGARFEPFFEDGCWHLHLDTFYRWCRSVHQYAYSPKRLAFELKRAACENISFNVVLTQKNTTRRFWRVPQEIIT